MRFAAAKRHLVELVDEGGRDGNICKQNLGFDSRLLSDPIGAVLIDT